MGAITYYLVHQEAVEEYLLKQEADAEEVRSIEESPLYKDCDCVVSIGVIHREITPIHSGNRSEDHPFSLHAPESCLTV